MGSESPVEASGRYKSEALYRDEIHDVSILIVYYLIRVIQDGQGASPALEPFKKAWKDLQFSHIFSVRVMSLIFNVIVVV